MRDELSQALARLIGERCPGCEQTTRAGFCGFCSAALPRMRAACGICGLALPVARCPRRAHAWSVARTVAPFAYEPPLDRYLHRLKYHGARALGRAFGLLLAEHLTDAAAISVAMSPVDVLVPVPLARARARARGFNQAIEIARTLASELDLALLVRGIGRVASEHAQTGQTAAQRYAGVRSAFAVDARVRGARIAIVDDVVTTGATVNALAAALLAAEAAHVEVWAVARTAEPRSSAKPQAGARNT